MGRRLNKEVNVVKPIPRPSVGADEGGVVAKFEAEARVAVRTDKTNKTGGGND